ncbi:MAG: Flp pilus assembly complex ATPase component TadA [Deltaproteobacteria bacterium]|nr:Flp pilus assembly complex ATPase component TadA [Deltaproteobacteria bacterium]
MRLVQKGDNLTQKKKRGREELSDIPMDEKRRAPELGSEWSLSGPQKAGEAKPFGRIVLDQEILSEEQSGLVSGGRERRLRLGHLLVRSGALSEEMLEVSLEHQEKSGIRLGEALVELNFITEEVMRQTLCTQLNIPFINFDNIRIDRTLSRVINKNYAQRHRIVPIAKIGRTMTLVMDDPTHTELVEELEAFTGFTINVVTSTRAGIVGAFSRLYEDKQPGGVHLGLQLIDEDGAETKGLSKHVDSQHNRRADALVTQLISIALRNGSSDIHLETTDRGIFIRFRIDGMLQGLYLGPLEDEINRLRREIVSRIKILGKLDIAERRRPQDGSFRARIVKNGEETKVDFRISIIPGYYGENVVLRVLDARKAPKSLDELGFSERINHTMHRLLKRNTGILLVTGPTGSGKSTTLYGALMTAYRPGIKILTAEEPIEYVYDKITQCEVNPKIDNTFANYIRSFLRQDPEIIMIGEIRDAETAEMAFRAAQTGHLVLSTLHTNDAVSSTTRLLDLNVDPSLIASCLLGVLSQRLIRQICPNCKVKYVPSKELLKEFFHIPPPDVSWFKGGGCGQCNHTGYSGRLAVAELWSPSDEDIILINKGSGINELRKSSCRSTILMAEDAAEKLISGKTNLEELIRTLPYSTLHQFQNLVSHRSGGVT